MSGCASRFSAVMSDKAKEAELSAKMANLPSISDTNEPPLSKAIGSAEKVCKLFWASFGLIALPSVKAVKDRRSKTKRSSLD